MMPERADDSVLSSNLARASRSWSVRSRLFLLLGIALLATATYGVVKVRRTIQQLFEAEDRLNAMYLVCDIVGDFVESNNGTRWPASWTELEVQSHPNDSYLQWPRDSVRLQQLVKIDFSVTVEQAALQPVEHFTAVVVTPGPDVSVHTRAATESLCERLAKYAPQASGP
jgi:hypothetical protein